MLKSTAIRLATAGLLVVGSAAAEAEIIYGITDGSNSRLVSFDGANPNGFALGATLSGLVDDQQIRAIDFRPSNGKLYAISSSTDTGLGQLYTVNLTTGVLSAIGSSFDLSVDSDRISMDFNPVTDSIRVVSGANENLRLDPATGAVTDVDPYLAYGTGDPNEGSVPFIADIAYSNNVAGATSTTLFGYDYLIDTLDTMGSLGTPGAADSPNDGWLRSLGGTGGPSAFSGAIGFDISGSTGFGYLTMDDFNSPTSASELYRVNLATGRLSLVGSELTGLHLLDISASISPVPEPASVAALGLGALALIRRRRRA